MNSEPWNTAAIKVAERAGLTRQADDTDDGYAVLLLDRSSSAVPAPTTVTVSGYEVNMRCTGSPNDTAPLVVLLAGMTDALTNFAALQDELSTDLQVCSYDRLGEGASAKPEQEQTLEDCADLLHGLLNHLTWHERDIVLVGHSWGGLVGAVYAHRYPSQVHGLVLLDATPPGADQQILELIPDGVGGIATYVRREATESMSGTNPERIVYTGDPVGSLGDIPMTVVKRGKPILSAVADYGDQLEAICSAGQNSWAMLSTRSVLVTAEQSGHYIYLDQPDLTCELVRQAVNRD